VGRAVLREIATIATCFQIFEKREETLERFELMGQSSENGRRGIPADRSR